MFRLNRKGQSGLELGLLLVMAILALIALQHYFKKAYQGRLKSSADDVGSIFSLDNGSRGYVATNMSSTFYDDRTESRQATTYYEFTNMTGK
jgi:uncharacterized protein (UPF0333 family)